MLQGVALSCIGLFGFGIILAIWYFLLPPPFSLRYFWYAGLALSISYIIYRVFQTHRALRDESLSRELESWAPEIGGFLTALELGRAMPTLDKQPLYSPVLAQARIDQVQQKLTALRPATVVPIEELKQRAYALFAVAALFFLSFGFYPQRTSEMLRSLLYAPTTDGFLKIDKDEGDLVVSDLKVVYQFPAYTQKPPRTIPNSDGSFSALKGTQIQLTGRAIMKIRRAEILLNDQQRIPLEVGPDKMSLKGSLNLLNPGFYRFQLVDKNGRVRLGPPHSIQLIKDRYPRVKVTAPTKEVERQERDALRIRYQFSDDFGLSKVSIVFRNVTRGQKKPTVQKIQAFENPPKSGEGQMLWQLRSAPFDPGDRIAYQIEVLDNDTISGPKRTRSETRYLKIYSPLENHDKLLASQEKLLTQMVHILGDVLERPDVRVRARQLKVHLRKLNSRGDELLKGFGKLLPALRKDTLTKSYTLIALDNLRVRYKIRHMEREMLARRTAFPGAIFPRITYISTLKREETPQEDDVNAFVLLLNRQRLDLLAHLSKKLQKAQNRLRDLLEEYRKTKSKETLKALMQEMKRVERLIRQIMKRMRQLNRSMPDEFLNMDAFRKKGSLRTIQKMRKSLKSGNIEDAVKDLAKFARQVERMASQLDKYSKEAGGRAVNSMQQALKQLIDNLHQLEQKQRRLAGRTQSLRKTIAKRMQKALKDKIKKLVARQKKRIEQIKKHIHSSDKHAKPFAQLYRYNITYDSLKTSLKELEKLLKEPDIHESLDVVRRFLRKTQRLGMSLNYQESNTRMMLKFRGGLYRRARRKRLPKIIGARNELNKGQRIARKIERDLDKFFPSPKPYMNKNDRKLMQRYRNLQRRLRSEARKLQRNMQQMNKRLPVFRPGMQRNMKGALRQMRRATRRLGAKEPRSAYGHQQHAISKLSKLRKALRQSLQRQQGKQGQKPGQKGNRSGSGQRMGNRRQNEVKIPKPGDHKAPKALRQDILDAMKEKVPKRYRERVRRYYEKLVE
tara:strand:+ start:11384 stop:14425 length:3042 start_codon:yes stop_codon:yes gene_type:complete